MTHASADLHVYLREIAQGERTSLSVLAGFVSAGAKVLDLGTGSGALGQHLREQKGCTVDGVTINEKEAALARPCYRRVEVADLELPDWTALFAGQKYDFIVCGDVLEHLPRPETTLQACHQLMAPGGRLLVSVPNAAYCGLMAELMQGKFTYRDEGLLDRTHLRFFTRRSLTDLLAAQAWTVEAVEPVDLPLIDSEFRAPFDQLPPAVARYLLALPDAGAYQLVVAAGVLLDSPGGTVSTKTAAAKMGKQPANAEDASVAAVFSAQLYVGNESGFDESQKLVASGRVGVARQVLRFELPKSPARLSRLRLDPADRPGFLHLHRISLMAGAATVWQWRCEADGLEALENAPHKDMLLRAPWPAAAALLLLLGDDPYIELPVPHAALAACGKSAQAVLEVELGWPMSADYMALVETVAPLQDQLQLLRIQVGQARDASEQAQHDAARAREESTQTRREASQARLEAGQLRVESHQARGDLQHIRNEAARALQASQDAEVRIGQLRLRETALIADAQAMRRQHDATVQEKNQIARHRLAVQADLAVMVRRHEALAEHLHWIEQSTVFRMTRPLVRAKMAADRLLGRRQPAAAAAPIVQARPIAPVVDTVDVIVPVYRGLAETQLCIRSALSSQCLTPWRLIVLNDASPEPEVTEWLRTVSAQDSRIVLLENEENLGFVATVNRGMAHSDSHDVLLLNSDTEVAGDWLDRLRRAAYGDARVASVTPFSNNATICSYPLFCEGNELPPGCDTAGLDRVFAETNAGQVVDVPTGVGFCMYIRRDSLRDVGLFNVKEFGKGYGEENDFCRRAADAGWRNLHALDVFVLHTGGVSFGSSKSAREIEAVEKLRRLHPSYDGLVHDFVNADPARTARLAVDLARVRGKGLPCVLAVLHDRGGGTLRHAFELARHLQRRAVFFSLIPAPGSAVWLELIEPGAGFRLEFQVPGQWQQLLEALHALGIAHVHYHHLLGHHEQVRTLGEQLGVGWDFTAHDFHALCPRITLTDRSDKYCGEQGGQDREACPQHASESGEPAIADWRLQSGLLLTRARHVLVPSRDTGRRLVRSWPSADVRLAAHTDLAALAELPAPQVAPLPPQAPFRVAVIGALSRIKGADLLEDVAVLAAKTGAPIEFHLIGFAYRELRKQPGAALTVHGPYKESDLPSLLDWLKPDVVWFPALWPETYSYTLSACLVAGLPVVAPDIGSFAERLSGRQWSWIVPWDAPAQGWLDFFADIRERHFATGQAPRTRWSIAGTQDDLLIGGWSYDTDYLEGIAPMPAATPLDAAFLSAHRPGPGAGLARQRRRLKHLTLTALVRLRSAPPLRRLARTIPLRWQTQVKSWLRA